MATISLCMIVKNEEAVLARCLDSIRDAVDEIVVVDTGSTDSTREIARRYTPQVLEFAWVDDFAAARNFAYSHAAMDYQMWLDADDVLPREEAAKLIRLKDTLAPDVDMVTMKYHTHFDQKGAPVLTSTRERLTRREKNYRWQDPVHECIPLAGNILHSDIAIHHRKPFSENAAPTTRNLDIYEGMEAKGAAFTPRQLYYFARELRDHARWAKAAHYFRRFLEEGKGWGEDNIAACLGLAACHRALGEEGQVLPALLRGFRYGGPRAELCCEIGYYHKRRGNYQTALEWFRVAAGQEIPQSLGFLQKDYWGYIPLIESCVCCCHLGQYEKAWEYNRLAGKAKPDNAAVLQNERFLAAQNPALQSFGGYNTIE